MWLPECSVRTRHRRTAAVEPQRLWECARGVRLTDAGILGCLIRWRIPGTPADQTFDELFRRYPFTVLEEDDGLLLSGLCGRIWTFARDYPRLDGPAAFRDWDERGTVRVLVATWVEPGDDGGAAIVSEARVAAVDRIAALRLRALWLGIGRFERLIGAEPLRLAVRRADQAQPSTTAAGTSTYSAKNKPQIPM